MRIIILILLLTFCINDVSATKVEHTTSEESDNTTIIITINNDELNELRNEFRRYFFRDFLWMQNIDGDLNIDAELTAPIDKLIGVANTTSKLALISQIIEHEFNIKHHKVFGYGTFSRDDITFHIMMEF